MLVGVQWTTSPPSDWQWLDVRPGANARLWERTAKKAKRTGLVVPDTTAGWPMACNVQGVVFEGMDCYAVQLDSTGTGLVVTGWTEDYPGDNYATQWTFLPPAPDPAFGGQVNTRQTLRVWSERPEVWPQPVSPWSQFVRPPEAVVRYGVLVADPLLTLHKTVRALRGWRDWIA